MSERYPSRHGIAVSPLDIWLPETRLNPEKKSTYTNHHTEYYARMYGGFLLYRVFHDLASNQQYLPADVHQWIHDTYGPPEMPKPIQALIAVEQAWGTNGMLQVREKGGYIQRPVDTSIMQLCIEDYDRIHDKL